MHGTHKVDGEASQKEYAGRCALDSLRYKKINSIGDQTNAGIAPELAMCCKASCGLRSQAEGPLGPTLQHFKDSKISYLYIYCIL
jgi:hypothetical protein